MIKAVQLIFEPVSTWARIALDQKKFWQVLLLFLTPLVFLSVAGEAVGVHYFGKFHNIDGVLTLPHKRLYQYLGGELLAGFLVVLIGARVVTTLATSFHPRHRFAPCFTVVAYSLSPLFLFRLLDAVPAVNPWASFCVGILLSIATLYYGIPTVLQPDPPNTFGLYIMSAMLLVGIAGLGRLLTLLVLAGKLRILNADALYQY